MRTVGAAMMEAAAAPSFQNLIVSGAKVRSATHRLLGDMTWHRRLDQAVAAARAQNKPIVWVQALGELRGLT
ncbi:MAG: hypothetical protein R3F56_20910 [Planctomycetota bacterium]